MYAPLGLLSVAGSYGEEKTVTLAFPAAFFEKRGSWARVAPEKGRKVSGKRGKKVKGVKR
jgi:hypothetical protein